MVFKQLKMSLFDGGTSRVILLPFHLHCDGLRHRMWWHNLTLPDTPRLGVELPFKEELQFGHFVVGVIEAAANGRVVH